MSPLGTGVLERARDAARPARLGRVSELLGLQLRVTGLEAAVGDLVSVEGGAPVLAEVVASGTSGLVCLPLGSTSGLTIGAPVPSTGGPLKIGVGDALRGRVLDGLGSPIDGGPSLDAPRRGRRWRTPPPVRSAARGSTTRSGSACAPSTPWSPAAAVSGSASWPAPASASPACCRWSRAAPTPRSR